jgi:hypothetical protein
MSRHDDQRLADILASAAAIAAHTKRGGLDDGLIYDAVRIRLIEIGEAVKSIDPALLAHEPDIPGSTSPACATTSHTATSTPPTPENALPLIRTGSAVAYPRRDAGRPDRVLGEPAGGLLSRSGAGG